MKLSDDVHLLAERTDDLGHGLGATVLARSGEKVLHQSSSINSTHAILGNFSTDQMVIELTKI